MFLFFSLFLIVCRNKIPTNYVFTLSIIIQCLPTDLKRLVKSFSKKDGILALRTLESNILTPSAGRENYLRDKLKESTMTCHQDPNRFLSYIVRVCEELKQIGGTITDSEVENIILRKLPRSYDNLVKSYRRLEDEKKGLTFLMKDIKEEYELMRFRNPELYQIRGRKTIRTHRANAVNTLEEQKTCWHCKKPGHFKRDCPERRNQQNEKKYTANLAQKKNKKERRKPKSFNKIRQLCLCRFILQEVRRLELKQGNIHQALRFLQSSTPN